MSVLPQTEAEQLVLAQATAAVGLLLGVNVGVLADAVVIEGGDRREVLAAGSTQVHIL